MYLLFCGSKVCWGGRIVHLWVGRWVGWGVLAWQIPPLPLPADGQMGGGRRKGDAGHHHHCQGHHREPIYHVVVIWSECCCLLKISNAGVYGKPSQTSGGRWYAPKCVTPGVTDMGHSISISKYIYEYYQKTSQELRMLSSVTINCQVTKIVIIENLDLSVL